MGIQTVGLALIAVTVATAGQLLLKSGMTRVGAIGTARLRSPLPLIRQIARTWQVVAGLALFVLSSMFWLAVVSRVPLSIAYPFVGLTYVLITLIGKFGLKEHVPHLRWAGIALIVAGIIVVGLTSNPEPPAGAARHRVAATSAQ